MGQNIISKNQTETSVKRKLFAIILNRAYVTPFVLSAKPRFGATWSLDAKLRLGGENKIVT